MKYCPNCGNTMDDDASFCGECGHVIIKEKRQTSQKANSVIPGIGIIFAIISVVFSPPVFGGLGIFMGFQTKKYYSDKVGTVVIVISTVCLIAGMVIGYITFSNV